MAKVCKAEECTNPVFSKGFCTWHQWKRTDKDLKSNNKIMAYKKREPQKSKQCGSCKENYTPYHTTQKFCSSKCRNDVVKNKRSRNWSNERVEKRSGKGNPAYKHGLRAGGKVADGVGHREYQRVRDGMKSKMISEYGYLFCELCLTNNSMRWEMHHLIFRSEKPRHKHLHSEKNLIHLCIKCHNIFHSKKSVRNKIVRDRGLHKLFGYDVLNK